MYVIVHQAVYIKLVRCRYNVFRSHAALANRLLRYHTKTIICLETIFAVVCRSAQLLYV